MDTVRWGILGTGRIANAFAQGLTAVPDATLYAVGSRSPESADAFGAQFDVPKRYGTYAELAADPHVDAIYVASPHALHYEHTLLCLDAGKAVLCEKPFMINARETEHVIAVARERNLVLVEAMWTRWLPLFVRLRELLADGVIGEVRMLQTDFGYRTNVNPQSRLFDLTLGGGALMDVGVYCVSLASMLFGTPDQIESVAEIGSTGVDEQAAIVLKHGGGQLAVLATAIRTATPQEATIIGADGTIKIDAPWWRGTRLTIKRSGKDDETIEVLLEGNGYNYEAIEVGRLLRSGQLESAVLPLNETLAIMQTLDQIRAQWHLRYPNDDRS